jgi:hypothetical protein
MDELKRFIQTYLSELRNFIGQFSRRYWAIFPDFFYRPYIIRARKCSNGVAILFKRPAPKESINVKNSKKRTEEIFLPYLPHPPYFAVFAWTNARRVWHLGNTIINFDWSRDPAKGKRFQGPGEDFRRMSVMHLEKSNEVQMMNCRLSGVSDRGRVKRLIRFLWMITEGCVELTEQKAKWYARNDFYRFLNHILFVWHPVPGQLSKKTKKFLIQMLEALKIRFQELISRTDTDEPEVQDFLEDHKFLIDLNSKRVWAKQDLGKRNEADFILGYTDSIRVLEIKRPHDRVYIKNLKFSAITRRALSELERYQQWIESNKLVAKGRYGSGVLKKGWAIIGRESEMTRIESRDLASWNSRSDTIEIKTYDYLVRNFDSRIKQMETF